MRRFVFWTGWAVLIALPIIFVTHALIIQNIPKIQLWQWVVPFVAVLMIALARNRDDVLHHHLR